MSSSSALRSVFRQALAATVALAICAPASALELNAATTLSARHSNNTLRTKDDQENNFSLEPGVLLNAIHNGNSLQAALDYQFERRFHTEDRNQERNFFSGGATIDWMILPDRLELNLEQASTESTRTAVQRGAPNDTVVTDNLSVGPSLFFRMRGTDQLRFTYLYEDRNAALDEDDSTSDVLSGSYAFRPTEYSTFTLEHREEDIAFSSDLARDIDVTKQTLTYSYRNTGVWLNISGGYSEYKRDGADTVDGGIGDVRWQKDMGSSSFVIYGRRQITNQSFRLLEQLGDITDLGEFTLFLDSNIAEVFTETAYGVQFSQTVGATQFRIAGDVYRYDYDAINPDRSEYIITLGADRRVNRNITLSVDARYRENDIDAIPGSPLLPGQPSERDDLFIFRTEVGWSLASNLNLGFGVEYTNNPGKFNETETYITATYDFFKRR